MYSPAALPSMQRAAPAKKRRLSAITGSSSRETARIGLPALSASKRASSSPCCSSIAASASSACERSAGVRCDQSSNARRAAATARSTSSTSEIGAFHSSWPVAGLSTAMRSSPSPAAGSPSIRLRSGCDSPAIAASLAWVLGGYRFWGIGNRVLDLENAHPRGQRASPMRARRPGGRSRRHARSRLSAVPRWLEIACSTPSASSSA